MIINKLQVPTLVVVPNLELKRQLTETLRSAFGTGLVGPLNADKWCPIAVENVDALDPKEVLKAYDCVIIDEFHHAAAATYRKLNQKSWTNVFYRFGLTATPFRSDENERLLLESVLSKVIYRQEHKAAVELGRIVPLEAYYVDLPKVQMKGDPTYWPAVYTELVVNNTSRNRKIAWLMKTLHMNEASTLCLVKEIAHGEAIKGLTDASFANGQDECSKNMIAEFSMGQLKTLIGTSVVGEGVDTRACEWVILAGGGKSRNQFMQQCGRAFRRYPGKESAKVILFRDSSHPWLLKHFNACVKFFRDEYNVKPVKLEIG
jgi:superfamily II DNA or RNA helicase